MARSRKYSIADARTHLPSIVNDAEGGIEIELTRRGKPIAVVISIQKLESLRSERRDFGSTYATFLDRYSPHEIGVDDDFFRSIRDRNSGREVDL